MKKYVAIIFIIVFSFLMIYYLRSFLSKQNKINTLISEQVEYVNNYHGVISRKVIIGCDCVVKLKSDYMVTFPWADNLSAKPKHLCQFLVEGDSIYKPAYSDSLFINRESKEYHFVLRKRIWR